MAQDKISVITPVLLDSDDKTEWLKEAVSSVVKQTYQNWEMVIVNDGGMELPEFNDDRIKVINLPDTMGAAIARNTAVNYAEGPLLLALDADDILTQNALELLYNKYEKGKFVYGNVQLLVHSAVGWRLDRQTAFPEFSCDRALNLSGGIPVTALHSKEDHVKAGGWKTNLQAGLEDVEYWIAMVRNCVLGIRIEDVVLHYRKHPQSRSEKMKQENTMGRMRNLITEIHKDIYSGGIMPCPGGCGGKKRSPNTVTIGKQTLSAVAALDLRSYSDNELIQLKYIGNRKGSFGLVGGTTGISYRIKGPGHEFLIHQSDRQKFTGIERSGPLFSEVKPKTLYVHSENVQVETKPLPEYNPGLPQIASTQRKGLSLDMLDQNEKITRGLAKLEITVEQIAKDMVVGDLRAMNIPGLGPATELRILTKAKELYYG